jgi:hypothetical protein
VLILTATIVVAALSEPAINATYHTLTIMELAKLAQLDAETVVKTQEFALTAPISILTKIIPAQHAPISPSVSPAATQQLAPLAARATISSTSMKLASLVLDTAVLALQLKCAPL